MQVRRNSGFFLLKIYKFKKEVRIISKVGPEVRLSIGIGGNTLPWWWDRLAISILPQGIEKKVEEKVVDPATVELVKKLAEATAEARNKRNGFGFPT